MKAPVELSRCERAEPNRFGIADESFAGSWVKIAGVRSIGGTAQWRFGAVLDPGFIFV